MGSALGIADFADFVGNFLLDRGQAFLDLLDVLFQPFAGLVQRLDVVVDRGNRLVRLIPLLGIVGNWGVTISLKYSGHGA